MRQFVAGLGHAELVGGQLGGVHPVHQFFLGGDALARLDVVVAQATIEPLVTGIVEDAEHAVLHAGPLRGAGQGLEFLGGLLAQLQPLDIGGQLVGKLLPPGLDGKVFLRLGDLRLARVAVHGDEIAGEAGELVVLYRTAAPRAQFDHFAGAGKMVVGVVARLLTRAYGALNGILEPAPLAIAQQGLQIAGALIFGAELVGQLEVFEGLSGNAWQFFFCHLLPP